MLTVGDGGLDVDTWVAEMSRTSAVDDRIDNPGVITLLLTTYLAGTNVFER